MVLIKSSLILSAGVSVASAIAARTSIIKLIHKSWIMLNGEHPKEQAPRNTTIMQVKLTVSWN